MKNINNYVTHKNRDKKTTQWLDFINKKTRKRSHLVLEPDKCALIIIDVIKYFADPKGRVFLPSSTAIIPNIISLKRKWNENNNLCILSKHGHSGNNDLGMLGKFYKDYIKEDEPESEIINEIKPDDRDLIIPKKTYDAFYNTDLDKLLKTRNITQVLISGCLSHLCCETTARSAFVHGYEVYIACDAMFTSTEDFHKGTLLALADGFATILTTKEILTYE